MANLRFPAPAWPLPRPFRVRFDVTSPDHCWWVARTLLDDPEYFGPDPGPTLWNPAELAERVAAGTACPRPCNCGSLVFDVAERARLEHHLADLGDRVWATHVAPADHAQPFVGEDILGALTLEALDRVLEPLGWARIDLAWDGAHLTATFTDDGARARPDRLRVTPLDEAQEDAWREWSAAHWGHYIAGPVADADPAVLAATTALWRAVDRDEARDLFGGFGKLLTAVTAVGADVATGVDPHVLRRVSAGGRLVLATALVTAAAIGAPAAT